MRYAIFIEKAGENYSAYVPDLPGCVANGATVAEAEQEIRAAIRFHIDGLREDGLAVSPRRPSPITRMRESGRPYPAAFTSVGADLKRCTSARLIAACRCGASIFAPIRSVT